MRVSSRSGPTTARESSSHPVAGVWCTCCSSPGDAGVASAILTLHGDGNPLQVALRATAFALPSVTGLTATGSSLCFAAGSRNRMLIATDQAATFGGGCWHSRMPPLGAAEVRSPGAPSRGAPPPAGAYGRERSGATAPAATSGVRGDGRVAARWPAGRAARRLPADRDGVRCARCGEGTLSVGDRDALNPPARQQVARAG